MDTIRIENYGGYFNSKSIFFSASGAFNKCDMEFVRGINVIKGDIDSGGFGISYGISMRGLDKYGLILDSESKEYVDGKLCDLKDHLKDICYMDESFPLFKSKRQVNSLLKNKYKERLAEVGMTF